MIYYIYHGLTVKSNQHYKPLRGENDEETANPHHFNSYCACVC